MKKRSIASRGTTPQVLHVCVPRVGLPDLMLFQLGRPTKPCLSSTPAAFRNSPKQPLGSSSALNVLTTLSATVGNLWSISAERLPMKPSTLLVPFSARF